jgi:hypothetical protein
LKSPVGRSKKIEECLDVRRVLKTKGDHGRDSLIKKRLKTALVGRPCALVAAFVGYAAAFLRLASGLIGFLTSFDEAVVYPASRAMWWKHQWFLLGVVNYGRGT